MKTSVGSRAWWVAALVVVTACESFTPAPPSRSGELPRDIRLGYAEMITQGVEPEVSATEIADAVGVLVSEARVCLPWPALWLDPERRRSMFDVRLDLMARDWGSEVAAQSAARMQEFVDGGFLTRRERPELGAGAVTYALTPEGAAAMRGSPYGGERPQFCAPAGRRLGEVTTMEWGEFACGNLKVAFTHVADSWPAWVSSESSRARLLQAWGPPGTVTPGSVTLSRQWFQRSRVPRGRANGELRSVCYSTRNERVLGDDLNLNAREVDGELPAGPEPAAPGGIEGS